MIFFFFSSRRRHTRLTCDWSSDVCSSDLARRHLDELESPEAVGEEAARRTLAKLGSQKLDTQEVAVIFDPTAGRSIIGLLARSEERRVGKSVGLCGRRIIVNIGSKTLRLK